MDINNPPYSVDYIKEKNGTILYPKLMTITGWDMDTNVTKFVAHGLGGDFIKIVSVSGYIRNDVNDNHYPIQNMKNDADPSLCAVGIFFMDMANIVLHRRVGGTFDSVNFSSVAFPRGQLLIWFEQ